MYKMLKHLGKNRYFNFFSYVKNVISDSCLANKAAIDHDYNISSGPKLVANHFRNIPTLIKKP